MKRGLILSIGSLALVGTIMSSNVALAAGNSNQGLPQEITDLENAFNSFKNTIATEISNFANLINWSP